jgi:hypothetical protein
MRYLVLAIGLTVLPLCAYAQETTTAVPEVLTGTRVRAWPAQGEALRARVHSWNDSTLKLQGSPPRQVHLEQLQRLDVSRGKNRLLWATGGLLVGATAGVLIARSDGDEGDVAGALDETAEGLANMISGGLIGGVVGFLVAPERWRTIWQR